MTTLVRLRYVLTKHALDRSLEMGVTRERVVSAIEHPETDYPGRPGRRCDQRRVATRDGLAIVYSPTSSLVITVLWDQRESR